LSGCWLDKKRIENTVEPVELPVGIEGNLDKMGISLSDKANTINLKPVPGESGSGIASIEKIDGRWVSQMIADLPELEDKFFYEGWLVSEAGEVLYTGKLELRKGGWVLIYKTDEDLSKFKSAIITREQKDDQKPEKNVLEGKF